MDRRIRQIYEQVAAGEPEELRAGYLAIPGNQRLVSGTTVPIGRIRD